MAEDSEMEDDDDMEDDMDEFDEIDDDDDISALPVGPAQAEVLANTSAALTIDRPLPLMLAAPPTVTPPHDEAVPTTVQPLAPTPAAPQPTASTNAGSNFIVPTNLDAGGAGRWAETDMDFGSEPEDDGYVLTCNADGGKQADREPVTLRCGRASTNSSHSRLQVMTATTATWTGWNVTCASSERRSERPINPSNA